MTEAKKYTVGQRLLGISLLVVILLTIAGVPGKIFGALGVGGGMSSSEIAQCEKQTLLYRTVVQLATVKSQFEGPEASSDWAIAELKRKGLSDACIQHLNQNI